jgi:acylphosphatase
MVAATARLGRRTGLVTQQEQQQREVHYAGRVQGVGFRYTVRSLAARFDVTGFVRNLPDGRVHLVAEGNTKEVDAFLDAVKSEMAYYIDDVQEATRPASGRFQFFEIRH